MEIIELERNEFIEFSKNYPYSSFFQSPHWIDVKKEVTMKNLFIGIQNYGMNGLINVKKTNMHLKK